MAATSKNMLRKLNQYISSYEATKGRKPSPQLVQSFLEAELESQYARAGQDRALGLQEKELGLRESERKDAASAAKMSGAVQVASLGAQGYLGYKYLTKPSPGTGGTPSVAPNSAPQVSGSSMAPTTERAPSVTGQVAPVVGSTPTQEGIASGMGGTPVGESGVQLPSGAVTDVGSLLASKAITASSLAPAYGGTVVGETGVQLASGGVADVSSLTGASSSAGATSAAPAGALSYAGPAAAGYGVGSIVGKTVAKSETLTDITPWGGTKTEGTMSGAAAGALVGNMILPGVGAIIGGVAGAIGGGSVICTELERQGLLSKEVLDLDGEHRLKYIDDATYIGYVRWAKYIVAIMQKYPVVARLVAPIGRAWAYEMASRMDSSIPGSQLGKVLMKIGVPICRWLGRGRA